MSRRPTEPAALVAAARVGLVPETVDEPVVVPRAEADTVLARARFDHVSGFLAEAVRTGAVELDDECSAALTKQWHAELVTCARLEALAVRTATRFDDAGIRWRLTKGPALAHLDYPDASSRTFGDIDIIVHPADWIRAFDLLRDNGYVRNAATLPLQYDARFGKGATLVSDGLEVDLHRRFAIGRFGVATSMEDVFVATDHVTLAGRSLPALDGSSRLLHACFHAALGGFSRLRAFRDVAQLLFVTMADWETTFAVARRWRAEAVVATAISETWGRLRLEIDHPARAEAGATHVSRRDRRVLDMFARGRGFRSQSLTALPRLPAYEVPRFLWALASPRRT